MLTFTQVTKRFGDVEAVRDLSFDVRKGEVFGLLGPNGAGKTTTVKLAVGLLSADAGSIRLAGSELPASTADFEQTLGYVPDEPALYPKLTGGEMLELVAALRNISRGELDRATHEFGQAFSLDQDILGHFTQTYSRGTKRKLSLLIGIMHDPPVLVLDEPTESLDALAVRSLRELLVAKRDAGRTILLSTNDLATAEMLCDRIAILSHGQLSYQGTREAIRDQYAKHLQRLERLFYEQVSKPRD